MGKGNMGAEDAAMLRRMQEDMQSSRHLELTHDKRPKLERAHSAAEKENLPLLQRSESLFRRQYSQQEQVPNRRLSTSDSGVEMSVSPHSRSLPNPHVVVGSYPQQTPRHPAAFPEDDPNIYRGELDGLMRQHAQTYQRSRSIFQDQKSNLGMPYDHSGIDISRVHSLQPHHHQNQEKHPQRLVPTDTNSGSLHQQRSFSSSEEERSTPECASDEPDESEKGEKQVPIEANLRSTRNKAGDRNYRQVMLAEKMKKFLAQPQGSSDNQKMIVHMILRKSAGSGGILGLKVTGGQLLEDGRIGSVIEKVKEGTPAAIDGRLRPGDEVIKWNSHCLQDKSAEEVANIIAQSRDDTQVELIVARNHLDSEDSLITTASTLPIRTSTHAQWRQMNEHLSKGQKPQYKELYDVRRGKPSVLVTSPGSPDLHAQGRGGNSHLTSNLNVGGKLQVKLGYILASKRLSITIFCATDLIPRTNGQPRNPYAKMYLLPDRSEISKRRTKTLANTNEPKWNETFDYSLRKSDLKRRLLEISVWDFVIHEANDFLGEAILDLSNVIEKSQWQWLNLVAHEERRTIRQYHEPYDDIAITPIDYHLSPPSTTSRFSDSDTSEYDITDCDGPREQRRTTDGASISSLGSSSSHYSSPPPEKEYGILDNERCSRRDMLTQNNKRAALMITRDHSITTSNYMAYKKDDQSHGMISHRSYSAAPMESSYIRYRGRSQSPTGHRSLSPPEHRSIPYAYGYIATRFGSRSATATPTGSPKKRQLPQTPLLRERLVQDDSGKYRFMRHQHRPIHTTYRSTGIGVWERHYSGLSDSDLLLIGHEPQQLSHTHRLQRHRRSHLSPDKDVMGDFGDSDMESIASVASSAFSTQSERPRGSKALISTVKNMSIPKAIFPLPSPFRRSRRRHKPKLPSSECHYLISNNSVSSKLWKPFNKHHNLTSSPHSSLVRSKSAVVRSIHEKNRIPMVKSQTIDENLMKYSNSKTSENEVIGDISSERHSVDNCDDTCSDIVRAKTTKLRFQHLLNTRMKHSSSIPFLPYLKSKISNYNGDKANDYFIDINDEIRNPELPRSIKNIEYDMVQDIFSDDSMKTARKKIKKNMAELGEKLPKIEDSSRSYYDSNEDSSKNSESVLDTEEKYECCTYSGESFLSNFDQFIDEHVSTRSNVQINKNSNNFCNFLNSNSNADETVSPDRGTTTLEEHLYGLLENDHIYCSIEDNPSDFYNNDFNVLNASIDISKKKVVQDKHKSISSSYDVKQLMPKRANSSEGHLDKFHLGLHSSCKGNSKYHNKIFTRTYYLPEVRERSRSLEDKSVPFLRENIYSNLEDYRNSDGGMHFNFNGNKMKNFIKPNYPQDKRAILERAESTPVLITDKQQELTWEQYQELLKRHRNSSCSETRDERNSNVRSSHREKGLASMFMNSDEDFGSIETVVGPDDRENFIENLNQKQLSRQRYPLEDDIYLKRKLRPDRSGSYPGPYLKESAHNLSARSRKTSCPECQNFYTTCPNKESHSKRMNEIDYNYKEHRCSLCRDLELKMPQQISFESTQREQGSKRNVAISDTLEYYEYSMESESQCSENCGFGPYDSFRPQNRAPRPGNANLNIFDSQTATSDTAKNPRANVYHELPSRNATRNDDDNFAADDINGSQSLPTDDGKYDGDSHDQRISNDYNSSSGSYEKNLRHQGTSENGCSGHSKRGQFARSLSNTDAPSEEKVADGSLSDTAVSLHVEETTRRQRKSSPSSKSGSGSSSGGGSSIQYQAGLGKKSNSTSQLSATGRKRRLGFGKRGKSSFTVHRSEEVLPEDTTCSRSGRQPSSASSDGEGSGDGDSSWSPCLRSTGEGGQLSEFIDGLGPGQLVGRQVLGAPSLGDIQLALSHKKGYLEVEVIRARDLQPKPGSKVLPAPYVKVYLVNGKKCIAKAKTTTARKTLEPFYQQPLAFRENFQGCILQVTVWGDYGRLEGRKVFMGVAQIMLDDLNFNEIVFGWYKLFGTTSLVSGPPSVVLSRRSSATSLDSFKL
ncbi:regulating synaptic membrane exocytosis protein 2 isoform X3 [Chelonus insularis]|uniref:regulating synaptic membrane exocytosis protein 2 isoform X3 n=1 Tax=Chelonus insularis TaxID=460826 RepID=UPI0015895634|nr:regulating synaptic membrane exocytosis protein 2-like isoform X3 [Chelonus insularis]